jgi:hypothetical protein
MEDSNLEKLQNLDNNVLRELIRDRMFEAAALYPELNATRFHNSGSIAQLTGMANQWVKLDAQHPDVKRAVDTIATVITTKTEELLRAQWRDLSLLSNAFSKFKSSEECCAALHVISTIVMQRQSELLTMDSNDKRRANSQCISNLVNAFSKYIDVQSYSRDFTEATLVVAKTVETRSRELKDPNLFKSQALSNLSNGFGKHAHHDDRFIPALLVIAEAVVAREEELKVSVEFKFQHLANLGNAFSKRPEDRRFVAAMSTLSRALIARTNELRNPTRVDCQHLANQANSFSKHIDVKDCEEALCLIVNCLATGIRTFDEFTSISLSQLANALIRYASAETVSDNGHKLAEQCLEELLNHLCDYPDKLPYSNDPSADSIIRAFKYFDRLDQFNGLQKHLKIQTGYEDDAE